MPGNPSDSQLCFLWLVEYAALPAFNGNYMDFLFYRGKKDEKHLRQSRISLLIGVGTPLAVLGIFKYYDFFVTSFCDVFHLTPGVLNLILPVGISFYTFQALSYTIDVYTGKIEKEKSFLQFALYLSFFHSL